MDYSNSKRFAIARKINKAVFAIPFQKSIAAQFAITKRILPKIKDAAIVPTIHGIRISVDTTLDKGGDLRGSIDRNLYYLGTYEIATVDVIKRYLKPGSAFIDVGSYNGFMALNAALNTTGPVIAYEPVPELFDRLKGNVKINDIKNIIPRQLALGSEGGRLKLHVNYTNRGSSSLVRNEQEEYARNIDIAVATLDAEVESLSLQDVGMIKIDVEGAELAVLKGAKGTIERFVPTLIVEYNPRTLRAVESLEFINTLGKYEVFIPSRGRHLRGGIKLVKAYNQLPTTQITNLVCIPRSQPAAVK